MVAGVKLLTAAGDFRDTAALAADPGDAHYRPSGSAISLSSLPGGIVSYASYLAIYRGNPWVNAVVTKLARNLARLPLHVFQLDGDGQRRRIRSDVNATPGPLSGAQDLDRLLRRPSPGVSGSRLWLGTLVDRLVHGNAVWIPVREQPSGKIGQLHHVAWRDITIIPEGIRVWGGPHDGEHRWSSVVHFGGGTLPGQQAGLSPLDPLARDLGIMDAVARQLTSFFDNETRLSGNLKLDGANDATIREVRKQVDAMYAGVDQAGGVMVTSGDFQPITAAPEHAQAIGVLKISREAACAVYDVAPPLIGLLEYGVKPLDPNSEIRMADGTWKRLADVDVDDRVLTHTGAAGRVSANLDAGIQPRLRLTTRRGRTVIGAPDHPFLTAEGWRQLAELKPGDKLVEEPAVAGTVESISADEARLLGYFVGDGSCGNAGPSINAAFTNADPLVLADFYAACERQGWRVRHAARYTHCVAGGVRQWLRDQGLAGKTAHTKRAPDAVLRAPNWIVAEFIAGYFDCDGTIGNRRSGGRAVMTTMSRGLADDLLHLLGRLKVNGWLRSHTSGAWNVEVAASDLARFADQVRMVGVKRGRLDMALREQKPQPDVAGPGRGCSVDGCPRPRLARGYCSTHYAHWRKHGQPVGLRSRIFVGDQVVSVEELPSGPVRCLAVDHPDHSYMANGVVTHNSNVREMREQFFRDALGPYADLHQDELAAQLLPLDPRWRGLFTEFEMSAVLRPDPESRFKAYRDADFLTIDEKRSRENLPPIDMDGWSNVPLVPAGVAPLGQEPGTAADGNGDAGDTGGPGDV